MPKYRKVEVGRMTLCKHCRRMFTSSFAAGPASSGEFCSKYCARRYGVTRRAAAIAAANKAYWTPERKAAKRAEMKAKWQEHPWDNGSRAQRRFTDDEIRKIRSEYKFGKHGCGRLALAKKYGVCVAVMRKIVTRERYKDVV